MTSLVAKDISKSYSSNTDSALEVLAEVSLSLEAGQNAAILGPSGSGKSTLLAILGTLDQPTTGVVRLADVNIHELPESQLASFRSNHIGFVFQDHHLLPQCTVLENVLIPFLADGSAGKDEIEQAEQIIERVGLEERQYHRPSQLSGGERQRVAIARAMIRRPTLLLADEPTGNLDHTSADAIADLLLSLQQENKAILVVVTHSLTLAARLQQRFELANGRLVPLA